MAFKNIVDDSDLSAISSAAPYWSVNMEYRTTLSRASQGVPVRVWITAESSVANDTGAVLIVDENGSTLITIPVTGLGESYYVQDGWVPATDHKLYVYYGGNTLGTLKVYSVDPFEYAVIGSNDGELSATLGAMTVTAEGVLASGGIVGDAAITLGALTTTETGTVDVQGAADITLGALTTTAAGVGWDIDATSGKGVPKTATEWSAFATAFSLSTTPSNLWLMQEASGNLSDAIGSVTLTAGGTGLSYSNAVAGWTRVGLGTTTANSGTFSVGSGTGPNASTTSVAILAYVRIDNVTGEFAVMAMTGSTNNYVQLNCTAAGLLKPYIDTGNTTGATNYEGGVVTPILFVFDRTNSRARVYTDVEKIAPTYGSGTADGSKWFGSTPASNSGCTARYLWGCWFTGASAEWLSTDANAKAMLQGLGWSVSGY